MILTTIYALLFYFAFAVLLIGTGYNAYLYARTPAPLKIPTMPAPRATTGIVWRMFSEVVFFKSLFRGNKWTWLFAMMFHASLLLITVRHLRYFIEPVWWWIVIAQPFGKYAGFIMIAGLLGLLARRVLVQRVRYISNPSDYLMLVLLLMIGFSGAMLSFVAHTDIVQFKAFMLSVIYFQMFNWQALPADIPLLIHLGAVILLMIIFPFSKLLHAPGVFFSPTRNQLDDSRERRHLAPWAAKLEAK
ncbi:MAG: respiratory nitrate reductase subunit gamma [Thiotrichaceae bacterium]